MLSRKSNYLRVPELYEQVRRNCRTGYTFYCLCLVTRLSVRAELYFIYISRPAMRVPRSLLFTRKISNKLCGRADPTTPKWKHLSARYVSSHFAPSFDSSDRIVDLLNRIGLLLYLNFQIETVWMYSQAQTVWKIWIMWGYRPFQMIRLLENSYSIFFFLLHVDLLSLLASSF